MDLLPQDHNQQVALDGSSYIAISTRDLLRAITFYERLFGFRVIEQRRDAKARHVLLGGRGDSFVAIHEQQAGVAPAPGTRRWSFAVHDLEGVRETLWNLGVVPVAERLSASRQYDDDRFIVIRDPDGHEIELVDAAAANYGDNDWRFAPTNAFERCTASAAG